MDWLLALFATPFLPHSTCLFLRPDLIALHVLSDGLLAAAYLAIPAILLFFARRRPHMEQVLRGVLIYFACFITACGVTHIFGAVTMWYPIYYLEGMFKLLAAIISVTTVVLLVRWAPRLLAFRSPEELEAMNRKLVAESDAHRRTAAELVRTVDRLKQSNRDLEEYAHVAAHDLKAPLRAVRSFSELLEKQHRDALTGDAREYLSFISDSARRMSRMVDDLLAMARLEQDSEPRLLVPLANCVDEALRNLHSAVRERDARVEVGQMPSMRVRPSHTVLLFQNLIANAIKFCPEGRTPVVRIAARPTDEGWEIVVADNGIGIPSEHREAVFGIFRRLHGESEYPGSGIGLSVCRRIAEQHGGRITIDASADGGCEVRIHLPELRPPADGVADDRPAGCEPASC